MAGRVITQKELNEKSMHVMELVEMTAFLKEASAHASDCQDYTEEFRSYPFGMEFFLSRILEEMKDLSSWVDGLKEATAKR